MQYCQQLNPIEGLLTELKTSVAVSLLWGVLVALFTISKSLLRWPNHNNVQQ